jgi:hypothetical protein
MITCSKCATENDGAGQFCANCGASLAVAPRPRPNAGGIVAGIFLGIASALVYLFAEGLLATMGCIGPFGAIAFTIVVILALIACVVSASRRSGPDGSFAMTFAITALICIALPAVACSSMAVSAITRNTCR